MGIQFIIGRPDFGRNHYCLDWIKQELHKDQDGPPLLYLVPEFMTFNIERELVSGMEVKGSTRAHVVSFSTISRNVLQEVGGSTRKVLDPSSILLLLRQLVDQNKENLNLYAKSANKFGFYRQLSQLIKELKRYQVSVNDLTSQIESLEQEIKLQEQQIEEKTELKIKIEEKKKLLKKLCDIRTIYASYQQRLEEKIMGDKEDYFTWCLERISRSQYIKKATIIMDGFSSFSELEYSIIRALMQHAVNMKISLAIDPECMGEGLELPDDHLFATTTKTYQRLMTLCQEIGVTVEEPIVLGEDQEKESISRFMQQIYQPVSVEKILSSPTTLTISSAPNARAEVEGIARQMIDLVRKGVKRDPSKENEPIRWKDITLYVSDWSYYSPHISQVFHSFGIPFFVNEQKAMITHPFIQFIQAGLDIVTKHWPSESVIRVMKTELLLPSYSLLDPTKYRNYRASLDQLENYILAFGMQGNHWLAEKEWDAREIRDLLNVTEPTEAERKKLEQINKTKLLIQQPFLSLHERMKQVKTIKQYCEVIYQFVSELDIPQKLEIWDNQSSINLHQQALESFISLLENMVDLIGDEEVTTTLFTKILDAGLKGLTYNYRHQQLDQVIIGPIISTRTLGEKWAFILGANEGKLPAVPKQSGLLTDRERKMLNSGNLLLAPDRLAKTIEQENDLHLAMKGATMGMGISYLTTDDQGNTLTPAKWVEKLGLGFGISHTSWQNAPIRSNAEKRVPFYSQPADFITYLPLMLRQLLKEYRIEEIDSEWWKIYNQLIEDQNWSHQAYNALRGLFYQNIPQSLSKETARKLWTDDQMIRTSISSLEKFQSCPFAHYVAKGLRLKPRKTYKLENNELGTVFHAALNKIHNQLLSHNRTWSDIDSSTMDTHPIVSEAVISVSGPLKNNILSSSGKYQHVLDLLIRIVGQTVSALAYQEQHSDFQIVKHEISFGRDGEIPELRMELEDGTALVLEGRIDRVDLAKADQEDLVYLRIVDYKSSNQSLKFHEVFYGLKLQLLAYLYVVTTHSSTWREVGKSSIPAGVFYFHVHNPVLKKKITSSEQAHHEKLQNFKMQGRLVEDLSIAKLMDQSVEPKESSSIVPFALNKEAGFSAKGSKSRVWKAEDLQEVTDMVLEHMKTAGTKILEGDISLTPYKLGQITPCTYCDYQSICQFDPSLEENQYRTFDKREAEIANQRIEKGK
ncbi:MAG TPA: helicase-exonuclease AddAB subunit AddB [Bacillota bacterium]|nr:helicase-exonuclease AddAB subunit AddB [Bacillota bacterium]